MNTHGFRQKKVAETLSLGERLKRIRRQRKITLERAEMETKIRVHFIRAIERNAFRELPSSVYGRGFIRRYAEYLGLSAKTIDEELANLPEIRDSRLRPTSANTLGPDFNWIVTPKTVAWIGVVVIFILFVGYIVYQVKAFAAPPRLTIQSPADNTVVTASGIQVKGATEPGATLYINDNLANVKTDGSFDEIVELRPGLNKIDIRSVNRLDKRSDDELTILYQAPATPTPLPPTPTPVSSPSPTSTSATTPSVSPPASPTTTTTQ